MNHSSAAKSSSVNDNTWLDFQSKRFLLDLEKQLSESDARIKMIVTDGVFSMDGTIAPLPEICDLADKYNALVFVDECHATGFLGRF